MASKVRNFDFERNVPAIWARTVALETGPSSPPVVEALRAVGLSERFPFSKSRRISLSQEVDFFEEMARTLSDDLFGLHAGMMIEPKGSNLNSFILFASSNLREALETVERFIPLDRCCSEFRLEVSAHGEATLFLDTMDAYERYNRQSTEFFSIAILRYLRAATGVDFPLDSVSFAHQRGNNREAFENAFGCAAEFGAEHTALRFDESVLDLKVPTGDDALCALLIEHGELLLEKRRGIRPGVVTRIERMVLDNLPRGGVSMPELASELGMSERTLARRLQEHDMSLRGIADDLRKDLAKSYLRDPGLTLSQIAYLLGYSGPSAFSASFRRWMGVPPGRYRDEELAAA